MAKREYAVEPEALMGNLDSRMQSPIGGWRVYNGRDDWFVGQVFGHFFYIPPDKGHTADNPVFVNHPTKDVPGQPGEMLQVPADGILVIEDVIGRVYAGKPPRPTGQFVTNPGMSAREVTQAMLRIYHDCGLVLLLGTVQDERLKASARKSFSAARVEKDKADVLAYEANIAAWKRSHPEQMTPPPPEMIRLARQRLDESESEKRAEFLYNCVCGTYATNNFEQYARHARINHGKIVKESDTALRADQEPEPPRRGPGRPPKTIVAVEAAFAKAAAEG